MIYKGWFGTIMKNTFNSKKCSCKTLLILSLATVFLLFFSTIVISDSRKCCKKTYTYHVSEQHKNNSFKNRIAYKNKHKQKRKFDKLSPEEKAGLRKRYKEWRSLPQKDKEMLRRRKNMWDSMSPQDRHYYIRRHKQWKKMTPEERRHLRYKLEHFGNLTPKEQYQIRKRFAE